MSTNQTRPAVTKGDSNMMTQTTASAGPAGKPQGNTAAAAGEYLAFKLGAEEYGIDILHVQEIRSFEPPTRIADAPVHVLGVQNLRGVIVPIVDLRLRLGIAEAGYGGLTVVIVLNIGPRVIGMVVDGVSDVTRLGAEQLRPVPEFNAAVASDHLLAIGVIDQRMLILIDIEKFMTSPAMGLAESAMQ